MRKYNAHIFVERNMGNGYAFAYPPLNPIRGWFIRKFLLPAADMAMAKKESDLQAQGELSRVAADGLAVYAVKFTYTIYKLKIMPDVLCPDSRAKGRSPHFEMYVVFPGGASVFSRQFNDFQQQCREIAFNTLVAGERTELLVEVPENLYPQKEK